MVGVPHIDHAREDKLRQLIDRIIAGIEPSVFPNAYGVRFVPVRLPGNDSDIGNSVLHYLYNMAVGLVIYCKARAFKAKTKARSSRPRPENPKAKAKAKKVGLKAKAKD